MDDFNKYRIYGDDEPKEIGSNYYEQFYVRHRRRTTKAQLKVLETSFDACARPDAVTRKRLADQLGMTPRSVQVWFQNRRAKIKKEAMLNRRGPVMNANNFSMNNYMTSRFVPGYIQDERPEEYYNHVAYGIQNARFYTNRQACLPNRNVYEEELPRQYVYPTATRRYYNTQFIEYGPQDYEQDIKNANKKSLMYERDENMYNSQSSYYKSPYSEKDSIRNYENEYINYSIDVSEENPMNKENNQNGGSNDDFEHCE